MAGCFALLVLFVILVVMTSGIANPFSRRRQSDRAWRQLAREYGGVFVGSGLFNSPALKFRYGSAKATFVVSRSDTKLDIAWPDPRVSGDIVSRSGARRLISKAPELPTGDSRFDWAYSVRTTEPREMAGVLNDAVRWQIEQLHRIKSGRALHVHFGRGAMVVSKQARLSGINDLRRFLRAALDLFDQAMLTRAEGIDFVESDLVQPLVEARCQVCGEDILHDLVFCGLCKTPHHRECWEYYGSCTVYGCQETSYVVPRVAEHAAPDASEPLIEPEQDSAPAGSNEDAAESALDKPQQEEGQ